MLITEPEIAVPPRTGRIVPMMQSAVGVTIGGVAVVGPVATGIRSGFRRCAPSGFPLFIVSTTRTLFIVPTTRTLFIVSTTGTLFIVSTTGTLLIVSTTGTLLIV
ncbi:hypothetical protein, partial [Nocardia sp. NPDC003345]